MYYLGGGGGEIIFWINTSASLIPAQFPKNFVSLERMDFVVSPLLEFENCWYYRNESTICNDHWWLPMAARGLGARWAPSRSRVAPWWGPRGRSPWKLWRFWILRYQQKAKIHYCCSIFVVYLAGNHKKMYRSSPAGWGKQTNMLHNLPSLHFR